MKNKLILFCLFAFLTNLFSQKETRNWYFGTNAGLDFSTSPPSILTNGMINTTEGCAAVSDAAGNLLFYTDGMKIYNKNHLIMANGTGLTGHFSTTQSAVIVKQPGSSTIFHVFSLGASGTGSLCFSTVDMALAAGMGSVTIKNTLLSASMSEKMTATPHCNGYDIWLLAHDSYSDAFRSYLVTVAGVSTTPVITNIGTSHSTANLWIGNMKVSPNGAKIGVAMHGSPGSFELYDFNNATGVISNSLNLGAFTRAYGCEFSPNSSKFYAATEANQLGVPKELYQWDLCVATPSAIIASKYIIPIPDMINGMQLASDGKIYIARFGSQTLGVISDPNIAGAGCNYNHSGQSISPKTCNTSFPNFMASYFKSPFTHTVTCLAGAFDAPSTCAGIAGPTNVLWNFGDPGSGAANSSTLTSTSHTYASTGTYTVQMIAFYACSSDTFRLPVTITKAPPTLTVAGNFTACKGENRTYTVSGASSYTWQTGANTATFSLITPTITTTYSVSGKDENSCVGKKQFTVTVINCTGLGSEGEMDASFSIYPNPANGNVFIETGATVKVRISDLSCRPLLENNFEKGKHNIDISGLTNGIYIIESISGVATHKLRLVKID